MPLIRDTDIATLRRYVKMNFTASAVKSMPDLDAAERKFLIPILTQPVFDALQSQVDANTIIWTPLLNLCRAAAAPLAVWLDLPFIQAQLSDGGLKTTHNANEEAAHQWEFNNVQSALAEKGMAALEDLLEFLIANASTYTWDNAEAKESFIRTGKEFDGFVSLYQPNVTFQRLKPLIKEVEDHFIRSAIGDEFFEELRDKASPSKDEKKAIVLVKKAVAQYTVVRSVERLPVQISPYGLMAKIEPNDGQGKMNSTAADNQLNLLLESAQREGDAYQVQLMQLLNSKASSSVFSTYFSSEFYTAPVVTTTDRNDTRTGIVSM